MIFEILLDMSGSVSVLHDSNIERLATGMTEVEIVRLIGIPNDIYHGNYAAYRTAEGNLYQLKYAEKKGKGTVLFEIMDVTEAKE